MGELGVDIKKRGEEGERRSGEMHGGGDRKKDVDPRGSHREGTGKVQGGGFYGLCYVSM